MKTQNDTETKTQGRTGSQFTLYLNPKTVAKFDRLAAKRKTTRSKHVTELMEQAVSAGLKKRAMA